MACSALTRNGTPLKLTGAVLARIFLDQITKWNDPAITALNPGVGLPDAYITVVHRSDGSGTTYIFSNYLSAVSPAWARRSAPAAAGTGQSATPSAETPASPPPSPASLTPSPSTTSRS